MPTDSIDCTIETLLERNCWQGNSKELANVPRLDLNSIGQLDGSFFRPAFDSNQGHPNESTRTLGSESGEPPVKTRIISTAEGDVWITGNAVMCECPECNAPVSIRLWLMVADCWYCESAIELSFEQQLAAQKLADLVNTPSEPSPRLHQQPSSLLPTPQEFPTETLATTDVSATHSPGPRRLVDIIRSLTSTLPAWLISLLVHVVLVLILALILFPGDSETPQITLSTAVERMDEVGGIDVDLPKEMPLEFDAPLPPDHEKIERRLESVRHAAEQDAKELQMDPEPTGDLPEVSDVKAAIASSTEGGRHFAVRDPRLRNEIVQREGGTTLSEAAVSRGLRWLASVQNDNGSWSRTKYNGDLSKNRGNMASTSLALLPFLGAGQTHEFGKYKKTVAKGLKWIIEKQKSNGELMYGIDTNAGIYAHGQASIVLIEALAMTGDEQFRAPAQKAIDYIESFQHKHGGWRYRKGTPGDTSVLGWQVMALQSARGSKTGLRIDPATLKLADQYLDLASRNYRVSDYIHAPDGSLYRYQPVDHEPKLAMTAEGLLCRMYLGWKRDDPRMMYGVDWILKNGLPHNGSFVDRRGRKRKRLHNLYHYYYATQVMHHYGGKAWATWNNHLRDRLVIAQIRHGKNAGSWNEEDFLYGDSGKRIYVTAFAICTLEVYYRHLPLFKQLKLE